MPLYDYLCDHCWNRFEAVRPVVDRAHADCVFCGYIADRIFVPTVNVIVPAHFKVEASWSLPDADDKEGWEARGGSGSQTHTRKQKTFREEFQEVYKGDL